MNGRAAKHFSREFRTFFPILGSWGTRGRCTFFRTKGHLGLIHLVPEAPPGQGGDSGAEEGAVTQKEPSQARRAGSPPALVCRRARSADISARLTCLLPSPESHLPFLGRAFLPASLFLLILVHSQNRGASGTALGKDRWAG